MSITPETLLDHVAIGVIGVDRRNRIQFANPHADHLLKIHVPMNIPLASIDPVLSSRIMDARNQDNEEYSFHLQKPWGGIEVHICPLGNNGVACFMQSLKVVEKAAWGLPNIRDMHLQFKTLLDHTYYGIYILDNQGVVMEVNEVAAGLIGLKREEMIGTDITALQDNGIVDQALTPRILKSKKPLSKPIYIIKRNKYIMASGTPVLDKNGEILFVVIIEHDMTIVRDLRTQLDEIRKVTDTIKNELSHRNLLELSTNEIIADSPAMHQVLTVLLKLAKMDASNILITGESGTGKGLLAKFIHNNGCRKDKPFISINCAALPEMLLEAELFGYEKGAFTGASESGKAGLFELASGGSIFLDEIGDLPFSVQAKLLKCLDEKEIRRLGGTRAIPVDCTIIAATNHNLEELVRQKKFRQDLYFRLNTFPVHIPALKERQEDILNICKFYLDQYNGRYGQKKYFSEVCCEELQNYPYPGNVRELKNIIKNAVVIKERNRLNHILPHRQQEQSPLPSPGKSENESSQGLNQRLHEFERKQLTQALAHCETTREMADQLDISQSTVVRKLKKHGLAME